MEAKPQIKNPKPKKRARFPWLLLLALLASVYVFWVSPRQIGPQPVDVRFDREEAAGS